MVDTASASAPETVSAEEIVEIAEGLKGQMDSIKAVIGSSRVDWDNPELKGLQFDWNQAVSAVNTILAASSAVGSSEDLANEINKHVDTVRKVYEVINKLAPEIGNIMSDTQGAISDLGGALSNICEGMIPKNLAEMAAERGGRMANYFGLHPENKTKVTSNLMKKTGEEAAKMDYNEAARARKATKMYDIRPQETLYKISRNKDRIDSYYSQIFGMKSLNAAGENEAALIMSTQGKIERNAADIQTKEGEKSTAETKIGDLKQREVKLGDLKGKKEAFDAQKSTIENALQREISTKVLGLNTATSDAYFYNKDENKITKKGTEISLGDLFAQADGLENDIQEKTEEQESLETLKIAFDEWTKAPDADEKKAALNNATDNVDNFSFDGTTNKVTITNSSNTVEITPKAGGGMDIVDRTGLGISSTADVIDTIFTRIKDSQSKIDNFEKQKDAFDDLKEATTNYENRKSPEGDAVVSLVSDLGYSFTNGKVMDGGNEWDHDSAVDENKNQIKKIQDTDIPALEGEITQLKENDENLKSQLQQQQTTAEKNRSERNAEKNNSEVAKLSIEEIKFANEQIEALKKENASLEINYNALTMPGFAPKATWIMHHTKNAVMDVLTADVTKESVKWTLKEGIPGFFKNVIKNPLVGVGEWWGKRHERATESSNAKNTISENKEKIRRRGIVSKSFKGMGNVLGFGARSAANVAAVAPANVGIGAVKVGAGLVDTVGKVVTFGKADPKLSDKVGYIPFLKGKNAANDSGGAQSKTA